MAYWLAVGAAGTIIIVAVSLSQRGQIAYESSRGWLEGHRRPAALVCRRISWDDVPGGKIHNCRAPYAPYWVNRDGHCRCQVDSLEAVYTEAFAVPEGPQNLVPKPQQLRELGLRRRYVLTDVQTLLALLLNSTDTKASGYNIKLRDYDTVTIASIHSGGSIRKGMTKKSLESILSGYHHGIERPCILLMDQQFRTLYNITTTCSVRVG